MNKQIKQLLSQQFPKTRFSEPLTRYSTFGIGGAADAFIEIDELDPSKKNSLQELIKFCKKNPLKEQIPFYIIGGGSNIIFHDKGFRGLIIKLTAKQITVKKSKRILVAQAGATLSVLIKKAKAEGFHNLDGWTGIPGTVGGAVRGNAGANGLETKDILLQATIFNPKTGRTTQANSKSLKMGYRHTSLKKDKRLVLEATFRLAKSSSKASATKNQDKALAHRQKTQPYGRSAGSFFKNPNQEDYKKLPKDTPLAAGYLIDQCGLKGHKIGGVQISPLHANFFQNRNDPKHPATQKDILALARLAKQKVQKKFKITLQEEIQIIPERLKTK